MRFVPNQNERRQSPCTCPYDSDNPDYAASKQDDYLKNDVHEATSAHRPSILRKILGYALTKSGKNDRIIKNINPYFNSKLVAKGKCNGFWLLFL